MNRETSDLVVVLAEDNDGGNEDDARIEFVLPVDGVYTADPKKDPAATRIDSLSYMQAFGLEDVHTMIRGTLRYPGWCVSLKAIADLGLLDDAEQGLCAAGVSVREARRWLDVIRGRAQQGMSGADWQVAWVGRHGRDFAALVDAYVAHQAHDLPVHEWSLS